MAIEIIPFERLIITFIPMVLVIFIMRSWGLNYAKACYSIVRMLLQLMLIGYALIMIFESEISLMSLSLLALMILASSWISLNTLSKAPQNPFQNKLRLFMIAIASVLLGGGVMLVIVTQWVLALDPWFLPQYMIPLAGMIFATAMTSISLAGERLQSELVQGKTYDAASKVAFNTSMIPNFNAMFAVGLESLPGMMTGQILSGVDPLIAVRYQIMVMLMILGSAGISVAIYLMFLKKRYV